MRCRPMPEFAYTAIDAQGREKTGQLAAANNDDAKAKLSARNFYVVKVEPAPEKRSTLLGRFFGPRRLRSNPRSELVGEA